MISVMNTNDFELDRKSDAIEDEPPKKPRVSVEVEDIAVDSYEKDNNVGESSNLSGSSEDIRALRGDFVDINSSNEKGRGIMELGSETVRAQEGKANAVDNRGSDMEMESRVCEINYKDVRLSGKAPGYGSSVQNGKSEPRAGNRHIEMGKSPVYDTMLSMFDEFAANGDMVVGPSKQLGYGYEVGDMVWGKVKSHPWWPGHIYSEEFASPSVRRSKRDGHVLVAFFGDSSYGWFDPAELIPFDSNFAEKSRQTSSRTFVKAVEEAVDEASRRRGLGLTCNCRNKFNFRATNVQGHFSVDVGDYEPGTIYSSTQIKKSRDSFQPRATLSFIKQLALAPTSTEDDGIDFMKNKATVLAYRKATYEEFDETYAQAFGYQPVRPPPGPAKELPPGKMPSRAPLSGRLVIAETLGKGKGSAKPHKSKDQAKKDKYLFKRRDESNELKTEQMNETHATSSPQPVSGEGSLAIGAGDYVLQKRSPAKPQIPAKHEQTETTGRNVSTEDTPVIRYNNPGFQNANKVDAPASSSAGEAPPGYGSHPLEVRSSVDKEEGVVPEMERLSSSSLADDNLQDDMPHSRAHNSHPETVEMQRDDQVQDGCSDSGPKKVKVRKRPIGEVSADKSALMEKKKRKNELLMREKDGVVRKVAAKPTQVASAPKHLIEDPRVTDVRTSTSPSSDTTVLTQQMNTGLELPQLLSDLQALALDPFHGIERRTPSVTRQVFLRFRSLVYQKSLALSPPTEDEANETHASKYHPSVTASDNALSENAREVTPPIKPQARPSVRPDDPTRGGRKRVPSDRQEEIAAKKKKKVNDIRNLTTEKKVIQKNPEAARDGNKQAIVSMTPKKAGPESYIKKTDQRRASEPQPTMLVMKFPSGGSLPSINELKARFARFGPMDHSATRIYWKTFTCRLVYRHKANAQAAYKFVVSSNSPFGNTDVKCHLREIGVSGLEPEAVNKVQKEDVVSSSGGSQSAVEQRAVPPTPGGIQLKSCLKKSNGEEQGGNGNGSRGMPRVKFMLGGEESNSGVGELLIGNKNNINFNNNNNNASFADGGASSSSSSLDFNSKNFHQKAILQPPPPHPLPILPLPTTVPAVQFTRPSQNTSMMHHYITEVAPQLPLLPPPPPPPTRNVIAHNFNTPIISPPLTTTTSNVDISQQMLSLLTKCSDVVTSVTTLLGYVPYHPL